MKKTKIPRKKVRGKNMKRLFACLLSLSMIPANGVAVFAAQEQAKTASTQSTEVKTQSDNEETSNVKFAQDSLVSKLVVLNIIVLRGLIRMILRMLNSLVAIQM